MKSNMEKVCRAVFYLLFLLVVACTVTAGCLFGQYPVASYCLFGGAALAVAVQPLVALIFCRCKAHVRGFRQWWTAIEAVSVYAIVLVCSPVIIVILILDALKRISLTKHAELDK